MTGLRPDAVLRRVPDLRLELRSDDRVVLFVDGRAIESGPRTLAVLEAFSAPARVDEVVRALGADSVGAFDWMDLTGTIVHLHHAGALVGPESSPHRFQWSALSGFDSSSIHVAMLNDHRRTGRYLEAIRGAVREGDVVVDVGTGTGVLAVAAVRAGARRVYAIEACGIAEAAQAVFDANDVGDRVRLIRGTSLRTRLPERADVIVSEIVGNEPLGEMVLETMGDAVRRFLNPGGRVVPARMTVSALPVEIPAAVLDGHTFTDASVAAWRERYGIDFSSLRESSRRSPQVMYRRFGWEGMEAWLRLAEPVPVLSVDFASLEETMVDATVRFRLERGGHLDGLIFAFELDLHAGVRFSTLPDDADATCSWYYPIWTLGERLPARPGDEFEIRYQHAVPGAQNRLAVRRVEPGGAG